MTAIRDVEYAQVGGKSLRLDLYVPTQPGAPRPLIVWIHGGGWLGGDKGGCPAVPLVPRGYVVASINYRLSGEAIFPAQIENCKGAIRFLRASAGKHGIDPERIGVWGASAGGQLVALLGTSGGVADLEGTVGGNLDQSSKVQAVADFCGPADFALFFQTITPNAVKPLRQLFGGEATEERVQTLARQASPVTYASAHAPPFLIVHGDKDDTVPLSQAQALDKALRAAKAHVTLHVVAGAGHGALNPDTFKLTSDFFDQHLRPSTPSTPGRSSTSRPAR